MFTTLTDNPIVTGSASAATSSVSLVERVGRPLVRGVDVAVDWTVARDLDEPVPDAGPPGTGDPDTVDRAAARCGDGNGTLTYLFFSDELLDIARAKAVCRRCTQRAACLDGALTRAEPWGVWGGELVSDGAVVVNKRPRGRPPKHPRPELVVDEVPLALLRLRPVAGAARSA